MVLLPLPLSDSHRRLPSQGVDSLDHTAASPYVAAGLAAVAGLQAAARKTTNGAKNGTNGHAKAHGGAAEGCCADVPCEAKKEQ